MYRMARVSKTWMYTLNNWTEEELEQLKGLEDVNKHVCGSEVGEEKGTPHLQGRITFKKEYTFSLWKKLNKRLSVRVAKYVDCDYERKEGNILIDIDNRKKKGDRTDMTDIYEKLDEGATVTDIAREYPGQFIRYHRGIEKIAELIQNDIEEGDYDLQDCCDHIGLAPLDFEKSCTHMVVGPPNCGKTQYALAHFNKPLFVTHMDDLRNFHHKVHDGIIFDDMSFTHLNRNAQIHIVDQDQSRSIHIRYGTARIPKRTKKIFTCNYNCFNLRDEAIARRVTVTEVTER